MEDLGYENRSEAMRDLVRASLIKAENERDASRPCVAALVYSYEPESRKLGKRLSAEHHKNADVSLTRTSLGIDEKACLEVALLRGRRSVLEKFSRQITTQPGIRYGQLVVVPI
jgi:CopG family transcriptional regulator, nickel-responsive regulator